MNQKKIKNDIWSHVKYIPVLDDSNMGRIEKFRLVTLVNKILKDKEGYEKEIISQKEWTLQTTDKQELLENLLSLYEGQRSRSNSFHKIEISDFGVCTFEEIKEYVTNNGFDDCEFVKLDRENMVDIRTLEMPDFV